MTFHRSLVMRCGRLISAPSDRGARLVLELPLARASPDGGR